ncbi:MAG: oligoendopeptidase F [Synergistaceae bacterium]|jgi:oligoendopeptidase F|nr:oligoendopeptidase F [Synergistaceae bacterium]
MTALPNPSYDNGLSAFLPPGSEGAVVRIPSRDEVADEFKWDPSAVFASEDDWEAEFLRVREALPRLAAFKGTLGESASNLLRCLRTRDEIFASLARVHVYASMKSHEDMTVSRYQTLSDRSEGLWAEASAASGFISPELLSIPGETLNAFIGDDGGAFDDYRFELRDTIRRRERVRSGEEETLLARASEMSSVPFTVFSMLANADMRFPNVKDEDGNDAELSEERYTKLVSSRNRDVRKGAFEALYETYRKNLNTFGAAFNGMLKASRFFSKARGYESDLAASLDGPNIPVSVYHNLVETTESRLEPLHRYMALRKRTLGLDELHMYDVYVPLVENPYRDIPWETAKGMVREALRPLGSEYSDILARGMTSGWIDVLPNRGKRSGAYSGGAFGTPPYILMNYGGELSDVLTLAHELGHSMHSHYSRANQPYPMSEYTIFCAETASAVNEELLLRHMLNITDDRMKRAYILNSKLERIRSTLYRQVMFASFERDVHGRGENGCDTSAECLCGLWREKNAMYFGPEMVTDELIGFEWLRIPHFYSPFYVYQYATGCSAALSLSRGIAGGDAGSRARWLKFLASGGSGYPIDLLKSAGVDMSTPNPISDAIDLFSAALDDLEGLLS